MKMHIDNAAFGCCLLNKYIILSCVTINMLYLSDVLHILILQQHFTSPPLLPMSLSLTSFMSACLITGKPAVTPMIYASFQHNGYFPSEKKNYQCELQESVVRSR